MTKFRVFASVLGLATALCFSSCQTVGKAAQDVFAAVATVRDAFNAQLPDDFNGPVALSYFNGYYHITISATEVHKDATTGKWSWKTAHLKRDLHIPITPGFNWQSTWEVTLGAPPPQ